MVGEMDDVNKVKRFKRPAQTLFNPSKLADRVQREGTLFIFEGNRYDSDGFLHKQFRMNAVVSPFLVFINLFFSGFNEN